MVYKKIYEYNQRIQNTNKQNQHINSINEYQWIKYTWELAKRLNYITNHINSNIANKQANKQTKEETNKPTIKPNI